MSTAYDGDAGEMAGNMRTKAATILDLPKYTFGFFTQETDFLSIKASEDPLSTLHQRSDADELKTAMEARYGVSVSKSNGNASADAKPQEDDGSPPPPEPGGGGSLGDVHPI